MFINNFDPVAFQVFSLEIRWYSLAYIFGLIFGWIYCKKVLIRDQIKKKLFDDYITYLIIGIIVGGRLGYVFIYNPKYFLNNLSEIPMIWNGGMSFHGALIGIFLGRIANFINSELYGRETDITWSVKFIQIDNLNRHPSQIYEALFEGVILFFLLQFFYNKFSKNTGMISSLFIIFYSVFRFLIEFTRAPDFHLGLIIFNLSMGQIISIIFLLSGLYLFYIRNDFKK